MRMLRKKYVRIGVTAVRVGSYVLRPEKPSVIIIRKWKPTYIKTVRMSRQKSNYRKASGAGAAVHRCDV